MGASSHDAGGAGSLQREGRLISRRIYPSVNTYSCWPSRTTSTRLPDRSPATKSNPVTVGSAVIKDTVPSSFLREATVLFHSPKSNVVTPPSFLTVISPSTLLV